MRRLAMRKIRILLADDMGSVIQGLLSWIEENLGVGHISLNRDLKTDRSDILDDLNQTSYIEVDYTTDLEEAIRKVSEQYYDIVISDFRFNGFAGQSMAMGLLVLLKAKLHERQTRDKENIPTEEERVILRLYSAYEHELKDNIDSRTIYEWLSGAVAIREAKWIDKLSCELETKQIAIAKDELGGVIEETLSEKQNQLLSRLAPDDLSDLQKRFEGLNRLVQFTECANSNLHKSLDAFLKEPVAITTSDRMATSSLFPAECARLAKFKQDHPAGEINANAKEVVDKTVQCAMEKLRTVFEKSKFQSTVISNLWKEACNRLCHQQGSLEQVKSDIRNLTVNADAGDFSLGSPWNTSLKSETKERWECFFKQVWKIWDSRGNREATYRAENDFEGTMRCKFDQLISAIEQEVGGGLSIQRHGTATDVYYGDIRLIVQTVASLISEIKKHGGELVPCGARAFMDSLRIEFHQTEPVNDVHKLGSGGGWTGIKKNLMGYGKLQCFCQGKVYDLFTLSPVGSAGFQLASGSQAAFVIELQLAEG